MNYVSKMNTFWENFDSRYWNGTLLHFGEDIKRVGLVGDDYRTAILLFKAEAGTLKGEDRTWVEFVERVGQKGPGEYSARAAIGYAQSCFFVGAWQTALDALHQAAVTALKCPEARQSNLRRLRADAYLRIADFWILFNQPGNAISYLNLAASAYRKSGTRIIPRLRLLCANQGPFPGALLNLAQTNRFGELYRRLIDKNWQGLQETRWPPPPDISKIKKAEGLRTAYEISVSESICSLNKDRLNWARIAVEIAEQMRSPGWTALADIILALLAIKDQQFDLASGQLRRAVYLIHEHNLHGLLTWAMLANFPAEADKGIESAVRQANEATKQVLEEASLFRDLVMRRRFVWAHNKIFSESLKFSYQARNKESALITLLQSNSHGWKSKKTIVTPDFQKIMHAREEPIGKPLLGEDLIAKNTMFDGVSGPRQDFSSGIFGEIDEMINISDTIARFEKLQLLREEVFGFGELAKIILPKLSGDTIEIYFKIVNESVWRIERWSDGINVSPKLLDIDEIKHDIEKSGLSITFANRSAPVDMKMLVDTVEKLICNLPISIENMNSIKVMPCESLNLLPFTYAIKKILKADIAVSIMLCIEKSKFASNTNNDVIRIAPIYSGNSSLKQPKNEVNQVKSDGDIVVSDKIIFADEILKYLAKAPSLFHFAGHAVNRNDQPEFAGLYTSDLRIVSAADILNIGRGPSATVLSACETGPGPLHTAEGAYGLVRSFLQTGSSWVVASLWIVGDIEAKNIMVKFFKNIKQGIEPEKALPITNHPFEVYRPFVM